MKCPEHGVKLIEVPWSRKGSAFTLLFKRAALTLVREMPVNAAARIIEITGKRLWRIVEHYVDKAIVQFELPGVEAIGLDESTGKREHNYVTVFIDMEKRQEPLLFATPGVNANIREAAFDMSPAFLRGVAKELTAAQYRSHSGLVSHRADVYPGTG